MIAAQLKAGLAALGSDFNAEICDGCKGEGRTMQTYTVGCGMGSYESMGPCSWCDSAGVLQGGRPAPKSVVNQINQAARDTQ